MPIIGTSVDYSGRKKDISIAFKIDPTSDEKQKVDLRFGAVSSFCAGTQKLIQRYMISLVTSIGSQPGFSTFGTDFIPNILGSNRIDPQDLKHIFNLANWKVISEFRTYQRNNSDDPLDEQLNTATLESFEVVGNNVIFSVRLSTLAGDDLTFLLPLPIVR